MLFSPWREGFLADSYARIWPGHGATRRFGITFLIFVTSRRSTVLRTSALSFRTRTCMQGRQLS